MTVAGKEAPACETGHGVRLGLSFFTGSVAGEDGLMEAVIVVHLSGGQEAAPEPVSATTEIGEELVPAAAAGVIVAGMLRINLWSPGSSDGGGSGSRLLASERVLLLHEGCDLAAEEVAEVARSGDAQDLLTDLALVVESVYIGEAGGSWPAFSTSHSAILRSMAEDLLEWANSSDCMATSELLSQCKQRLAAEEASGNLGLQPETKPPCLLPAETKLGTTNPGPIAAPTRYGPDADDPDDAIGRGAAVSSSLAETGQVSNPCSSSSDGKVAGDLRVQPRLEADSLHIPVSAAWAGAFVTHALASCAFQMYRHGYGECSESSFGCNVCS